MKPTLYIDPEGTVLVYGGELDPYLGYSLAPYASPFIHWALQNFRVVWLSDMAPGRCFHTNGLLGLKEDAIPVRGFDLSKAELLDPQENFYWLDSFLIPGEVAWLAEHGRGDRLIATDPHVGVTSKHKEALEERLRNRRRTEFSHG